MGTISTKDFFEILFGIMPAVFAGNVPPQCFDDFYVVRFLCERDTPSQQAAFLSARRYKSRELSVRYGLKSEYCPPSAAYFFYFVLHHKLLSFIPMAVGQGRSTTEDEAAAVDALGDLQEMVAARARPMTECECLDGSKRQVPTDELVFRPGVYGVITQGVNILLVKIRGTGRWGFPGGMIEKGEHLEAALCREVWEETGVSISNVSFLAVRESFFYHAEKGYHCFSFFYRASPKSELHPDHKQGDPNDVAENPTWVDFTTLQSGSFQAFGWDILDFIREK